MASISWTKVPVLAKMTLPSGNTYYFKDEDVRDWVGDGTTSGAEKRLTDVETAIESLANATHWLGVTSTTLSDGATTNPIIIGSSSVTAVNGDIVQDANHVEYIFNGNLATPAWQQLGSSVGTLGNFAYADEGESTFTVSGTANSSSVSFSGGTTDSVLGADTTFTTADSTVTLGTPTTASVTPFGSAGSAPSWTGTVANEELTIGWDAGTVPTAGTAVEVVTALPSTGNTASAQTITVGSNDPVTAVTGVGTATASGQSFTSNSTTITVTPKSNA